MGRYPAGVFSCDYDPYPVCFSGLWSLVEGEEQIGALSWLDHYVLSAHFCILDRHGYTRHVQIIRTTGGDMASLAMIVRIRKR